MERCALAALTCLAIAGPVRAQTTSEDQMSPGVFQINAPALHELNAAGQGTTIAILDSGIFPHPEFAGRLLPGFNAIDGTTQTLDDNGHGTHVAGIAAAAKDGAGMFGVAFRANLLPVKVLDSDGSGSNAQVAAGIQWIADQRRSAAVPTAQKAIAMNVSLGSSNPQPAIEAALRSAVESGIVIAVAAGNTGDPAPDYPSQYSVEPWANGQILVVGTVDANGALASFSNRAGNTAPFFLVTPGVNVTSTYVNQNRFRPSGTYRSLSGTSMSTPYVTGAVAVVKSGWQFLTAKQIADILLASAKDLGAQGTDPIYGRGLLDLKAALQPIGRLVAPTGTGPRLAVAGSSFTASGALRAALETAGRSGKLMVAGFDDFGRDFQVDFARALRVLPSGNSIAPMLAALDAVQERTHSVIGGGTLRVSYRSEATRFALGQERAPIAGGLAPSSGAFSMISKSLSGRELMLGFSGMGGQAFGLSGELARRGQGQFGATLANPYFSFAAQHMHAGVGLPLRAGLRFDVGVLVSDPRVIPDFMPRRSERRRQTLTLAELSGGTSSSFWSLGVGRLEEADALLGSTQKGLFDLAGTSTTHVLSTGFGYTPSERLTLGAQYTVGITRDVSNRASSLVDGFGGARSDAYAVFASLRDLFRAGDNLSLTLSQPLRMTAGRMELTVPLRADDSGAPIMGSRTIDLRPDGRELRADLLYLRPFQEGRSSWFVGMALRRQPDHRRLAPLDVTFGMGIRGVFGARDEE